MSRTHGLKTWLPKIAEAGLQGNLQRLQVTLLTAIRSLRKSDPDLSAELGDILAKHTDGSSPARWANMTPPPADKEEGMSLLRITDVDVAVPPILSGAVQDAVEQFLLERRGKDRLLREGFSPPCSMLLIGEPGTGKTMLAKWMARELDLPLIVQDLATSISSLLGKTGFNLRRTFDYAKANPCVLLLDEFDAIAKRRSDNSELGELKRIVNVLLKELEDWPLQSVLIAATNHAELLDPAVNRRFHITISIPLPGPKERREILLKAAGRFASDLPGGLTDACVHLLDGRSGSDIDNLMQTVIRRHLSRDIPVDVALISEITSDLAKADHGLLIRALRATPGRKMTVRDIASLVGKSVSTVHHHLRKGE